MRRRREGLGEGEGEGEEVVIEREDESRALRKEQTELGLASSGPRLIT
jgi:hypothetical protein